MNLFVSVWSPSIRIVSRTTSSEVFFVEETAGTDLPFPELVRLPLPPQILLQIIFEMFLGLAGSARQKAFHVPFARQPQKG